MNRIPRQICWWMTSALVLGLLLSLATCSSNPKPAVEAKKAVQRGEWLKAVIEYRKAVEQEPDNIEYRIRLRETEQKAADYYYDRGMEFFEKDSLDEAIAQFQQGLMSKPGQDKLNTALQNALARKEAETLELEGERLLQAGNLEDAQVTLQRSLDLFPDDKRASAALATIEKQLNRDSLSRLVLASREPITLQFRQTPLRAAFEFIAKAFGVNLIFDEQVENTPVTLYAKDVSFDSALSLMLTTTKTFYKKIGPNTVLVAPDTADKRAQFEDQLMRTYQLNTVRAKDMAALLKGVMTPKKMVVNEELNTLLIRDSRPVLELADRLIQLNDRKPAEVLVAVEILEVNRTKAENLGLDWGQQITTQFPTVKKGDFATALKNSTSTLPNVIFSYFKQDVDAKTLANPKVRVISGKVAKIHIGDRVPLVSSTIVDATGQTRTAFNYTDIGVVLTVDPVVHLDNAMTLKLGLEVSTLGQNLGTTTQPAYSIGTRTAETYMELRDGETAILGGLIQDSEQRTIARVAGLGDIPVVGSLFRTTSDSHTRTEVLLTITPHVLRSWDLARPSQLEFYSGTANSYADRPVIPVVDAMRSTSDSLPVIRMDGKPESANSGAVPASSPSTPPALTKGPQVLEFSEPSYSARAEQDFSVDVVGENLNANGKSSMTMLFNPDIISFVRIEPGSPSVSAVEAKPSGGTLHVSFAVAQRNPSETNTPLFHLILHSKKAGVSYLAFSSPNFENGTGGTGSVQTRASRVVIQ